MLGDNSDSGGLNTWDSALRIIRLQGVETDEEVHHEVRRLYTIRPAAFPQDKVWFRSRAEVLRHHLKN